MLIRRGMQRVVLKGLILFVFAIAANVGFAQKYDVDTIFQHNVYWKRMQQIPTVIKPFFDEQIEQEIREMLHNPKIAESLAVYHAHKDSISAIFKKYGLPTELQLVAFANTYMKEDYLASTGESGMWPLSYYIAKKYQLKVNSFVDERKNLFMATEAAAKSLADVFHIYRDWYFTIAAFRSGPVEMNKAIRLASNSLDYFVVEPYMDYTYRKSFSRYMASLYVVNFYMLHNIKIPIAKHIDLDTVYTPRTFTFDKIALGSNLPVSQLKKYNYQYKNGIVPNFPAPHPITMPKKNKDSFKRYLIYMDQLDENKRIDDSMERVKLLVEKFRPDTSQYQIIVLNGLLSVIDSMGNVIDVDKPFNNGNTIESDNGGNRWVYYTVKSGDNLGLLADCFDTYVNNIKSWNNLRSSTIMKGQRLKFMVAANKYGQYSNINTMSASQKARLRKKD